MNGTYSIVQAPNLVAFYALRFGQWHAYCVCMISDDDVTIITAVLLVLGHPTRYICIVYDNYAQR
jgi:hypothetical protein